MKLPDKHKRLGFLMVVSQVLLISFTIYWLGSQYKQEKEDLQINLQVSYNDSFQRVLDSVLMKHYIKPVLGDTVKPVVGFARYESSGKGVVMSDSVIYSIKSNSFQDSLKKENAIVTIQLSENDTTGKENLHALEQEMLLRSVQLVVQHVDDSSASHFDAFHNIRNSIDSGLFVSDFEYRIKEDGIKVKSIWYSHGDSTHISRPGKGVIEINGLDDSVPVVSIKKYGSYLIKQILPQILFALILILLTSSAFLIAYRSLRKQTLLNEMRSSFISNISHELKTPVSTVKVAIEALKNLDLKMDSATATEYLDMSARELKRLELLITRVLDNSIIEHNDSILSFEEVKVAGIIQSAIDSLEPKTRESGATISFQAVADPYIYADPFYLQGVFINLLDNSLKYGNGNPEILISFSIHSNIVVIEVTDNGPGIPDQYLTRVFDKFFRIPTSDIHNVKGYGLGLSYAHLIVEMHGGSINVRNNEKGCTFTIVIPADKA